MRLDFEIVSARYLVQKPHELDLHNDFQFLGFDYSVEQRSLCLHWRGSRHELIGSSPPVSISVEFQRVSELRVSPRDSEMPFTEDDCLSSFGYWADEDWSTGVIVLDSNQTPDPQWLTAIEFMSGAIILVKADFARARIVT